MKCCINGENVIRLLFLSAKLLKFEIQKCGQILCAHKPYFLMPGHNYSELNSKIYFVQYLNRHWLIMLKFSPIMLLSSALKSLLISTLPRVYSHMGMQNSDCSIRMF